MAGLGGVYGGVLVELLGDEFTQVIKVIDTPMEDKAISKEVKLETSRVRAILNELLVKNLVRLDRDRLDTGYCYYKWVRREDKLREYVDEYLDCKIRDLDSKLSGSDDIVFECGCRRVDYGTAIELGFTCPQCGEKIEEADLGKGSRKMRDELKKLTALRNAS
ncbi:MAG: hypothetical protein V1744_07120 [Candidatus Altiarchaeota archaeon]